MLVPERMWCLRLASLLALVLLGCAHAEPPPPSTAALAQPFTLGVGDRQIIGDSGLEVRFVGVQEDSRCPTQVTCIWAGRVVIELEVRAPGAPPEPQVLATCCGADASRVEYAGQALELVGIAPPPAAGSTIAPRAYRATLQVTSSH